MRPTSPSSHVGHTELPDDAVVSHGPARKRWRALALVSLSTILALSVWFSTNAIAPALEGVKGLTADDLAWLTISVQIGFVFGTPVSSVLNLADRYNARSLFATSAVLTALFNLAVVPLEGFWPLLAVRFATGAFLAGVYPPAMKILSGWFQRGRGMALGSMIAALTLGSGSPHLLRSLFVDNWEATIIGSTSLAILGGLMLPLTVADGPYESEAGKFSPRHMMVVLRQRGLSPNPPKDTDGRREESGRGVRELQGK